MANILKKQFLRESLKKNVPKRFHDIAFGDEMTTTTFNKLWDAINMHFGELELIARREYERGYYDGKEGRQLKGYFDE